MYICTCACIYLSVIVEIKFPFVFVQHTVPPVPLQMIHTLCREQRVEKDRFLHAATFTPHKQRTLSQWGLAVQTNNITGLEITDPLSIVLE